MITAILCMNAQSIAVGFVGDPEPQKTAQFNDSNDSSHLQAVLKQVVDSLLVSPRSLKAVIIEPPLFSLKVKQEIAKILLEQLYVVAIGFLPKSVCCLAGHKLQQGLVLDDLEKLAVPCFDFRELTPMICSSEEDDPVAVVKEKLSIDTRRPVTENIVTMSDSAAFQGGSVSLKCRQVWPLLTREKFRSTGKVWDSLYDMK